LIVFLWVAIGLISLVTALGLKILLAPVGPFVAVVIGPLVGVSGVFTVFIIRADRRVRRQINERLNGPEMKETIDQYDEESSPEPKTTE